MNFISITDLKDCIVKERQSWDLPNLTGPTVRDYNVANMALVGLWLRVQNILETAEMQAQEFKASPQGEGAESQDPKMFRMQNNSTIKYETNCPPMQSLYSKEQS